MTPPVRSAPGTRPWGGDSSVLLAVALAFADASIVVLALPQIVGQLHTTISHVVWVIMAYNVALILGVVIAPALTRWTGPRAAMLIGLAIFGVASVGCGASNRLNVLVAFRCLQGVGAALVLCGSLPLLAIGKEAAHSALTRWAGAAALGAAIGPAAGGVLTQVFSWRAIFLAQAPAAALAAAAVVTAGVVVTHREAEPTDGRRAGLGPLAADAALGLLSAGLIGALFFVVLLLINVWLLTPIAAAAVVSTIPLATVAVQRFARGRSPTIFGALGAILLAAGLAGAALLSHKEIGWMVLFLTLSGAGLGLSFTTLTAAALAGGGSRAARAGRTAAARDAGLVIGLLVLTPVFVHDLNKAPNEARPPLIIALYKAPIPSDVRDQLGNELIVAYSKSSQAQLPNFAPAFAKVSAGADRATTAVLSGLQGRMQGTVERIVTRTFRRALLYSALFALLVLPVLALARMLATRREDPSLG
jgi:MFS family permease